MALTNKLYLLDWVTFFPFLGLNSLLYWGWNWTGQFSAPKHCASLNPTGAGFAAHQGHGRARLHPEHTSHSQQHTWWEEGLRLGRSDPLPIRRKRDGRAVLMRDRLCRRTQGVGDETTCSLRVTASASLGDTDHLAWMSQRWCLFLFPEWLKMKKAAAVDKSQGPGGGSAARSPKGKRGAGLSAARSNRCCLINGSRGPRTGLAVEVWAALLVETCNYSSFISLRWGICSLKHRAWKWFGSKTAQDLRILSASENADGWQPRRSVGSRGSFSRCSRWFTIWHRCPSCSSRAPRASWGALGWQISKGWGWRGAWRCESRIWRLLPAGNL